MKLLRTIIIFTFFYLPLFANDDPQFWQIGFQPIGKYKSLSFAFRQEYRLDMRLWKCLDARFSLFLKKPINEHLNFEFHYTLINFRSKNQIWFDKRHRFDFELNPRFKITSNTVLFFRNRFEFIKFEHASSWTHILRQRTQVLREINKGSLRNISTHNEIFYNFNVGEIFEYRFCPIDILFKIKDSYSYRLFILNRWIKNDIAWSSRFVLGSSFEW